MATKLRVLGLYGWIGPVDDDPVGITDTVSHVKAVEKTLSDPVGILDSPTGNIGGTPTKLRVTSISGFSLAPLDILVSDTVGTTDVAASSRERNISDTVGVTDNAVGGKTRLRVLRVSGSSLQSTTKLLVLAVSARSSGLQSITISDNIGIEDTDLPQTLTYEVTIGDTVGATDSRSAIKNGGLGQSDDVFMTDVVTVVKTMSVTIADGVNNTDSSGGGGDQTRILNDNSAISDTRSFLQSVDRLFADNMGIGDLVARFISFLPTVNDSVGSSDTNWLDRIIGSFNDPESVTDLISFVKDQPQFLNDNTVITDAALALFEGAPILWTQPELIRLSEMIALNRTVFPATVDIEGITDSMNRAMSALRTPNDGLGITETIFLAFGLTKPFADSVGITDLAYVDLYRANDRNVVDPVGVSDQVQVSFAYHRITNDSLSINEAFARDMETVINDGIFAFGDPVRDFSYAIMVQIDDYEGVFDAAGVVSPARYQHNGSWVEAVRWFWDGTQWINA